MTQDTKISTETKRTTSLKCMRRLLLTMTLADIKLDIIDAIIDNNALKLNVFPHIHLRHEY